MKNKIKERVKDILSRSFVREFSWHTFANLSVQMFSFLSIIFVSRYLGPTNLGLMSFVQNYLTVFISTVSGMDFYFTWHIVKSENKILETFRFAIQKTYVTLFIFIFGLSFAYFSFPHDVFILSLFLFIPFLFSGLSSFWLYALSEKRARLLGLIQISTAFSSFLLKFSFVQMALPLKAFVFISGLELVVSSVFITLFFFYKNNFLKELLKIKIPSLIETFKLMLEIRYNLLLTIFWQAVMRADQLLLAKMTSAYTVGIYAAAVKITEAPNVFVTVLALVTYPRVAEYIKHIKEKNSISLYKEKLNKIFKMYLISGLVITFCLVALAPLGVKIMYGDRFSDSINILRIYAFSVPGLFVSYYYMALFGAYEERKIPAFAAVFVSILNIILVYTLTLKYGVYGTAFASALAYSVSGFVFYLYHRKYKLYQ